MTQAPSRRTLSLSVALIATVSLSQLGCATHVLSPPTQFLPLESPRPVAAGRTSVGLEGGYAGEVFGADIAGGSLVVRHGLADALELRVDGSAGWITTPGDSDEFRGLLSGRVGLKGLISPTFPHAAWFGGVGGGGSAAGGFLSADSGLILGYENPYIVPFVRASVMLSVPVGARAVDITESPDDERIFDTPHTSFGFRLGVGVRIPVEPGALTLGLSELSLFDTRGEQADIFGLSAGLATTF